MRHRMGEDATMLGRALQTAAAFASLLLTCSAALAFDAGWVRVAPPSEQFEVRMPTQPERQVQETSTVVGTVEDVSYRARRGEQTYLVNRVDIPSVATWFMSDESLLESIRESFLERGNGMQKSYADIERNGHTGKRLDFVMDKGEGPQEARAEFFVVDGKLLSFTGIVPQGRPLEDIESFLATIELVRRD